jgi:hypothetical protein
LPARTGSYKLHPQIAWPSGITEESGCSFHAENTFFVPAYQRGNKPFLPSFGKLYKFSYIPR